MRRILAFTLSIVMLGVAAGCAANPTPTASPAASAVVSAAASADASATPAKQWTKEEAINRYLKTENGKTTILADAIKADYTQFQIVSADVGYNLKTAPYEKVAPLLDKLATVQMTEGDINQLTEKPENVWNLQSFTQAGKLHGDSITIKCSTETQVDIYILVGDLTMRRVFTISDTDGAALRALAKDQGKIANAEQ